MLEIYIEEWTTSGGLYNTAPTRSWSYTRIWNTKSPIWIRMLENDRDAFYKVQFFLTTCLRLMLEYYIWSIPRSSPIKTLLRGHGTIITKRRWRWIGHVLKNSNTLIPRERKGYQEQHGGDRWMMRLKPCSAPGDLWLSWPRIRNSGYEACCCPSLHGV